MKKILIAILAIGLFAFIATSVQAEDKYVTGGFEASGSVVTGAGFQHLTKNAATTYGVFDGDIFYGPGVMGKYSNKPFAARANQFNFFVDGVELDIAKSFGENIRLRADLDFARFLSTGAANPAGGFVLEQAYATANIPIGNGVEFLLGRFNTPIGFEAVDVIDNDTISKTVLGQGMRPVHSTGAKLYYAFSDLVDMHFYVANDIRFDTTVKFNSIPGVGARVGFNWGEEGSESTLGISPFFGPAGPNSNKHYSFGGDVDVNWWLTESFALGAEALFRRDNATSAIANSTSENMYSMAGLLNLHYVFSDVWDGTLKYAFAKQFKTTNDATFNAGGYTGQHQSIHQAALAGGYAIADAAKFKLEGRIDMINPVGAGNTQYVYGGALAFAYNF